MLLASGLPEQREQKSRCHAHSDLNRSNPVKKWNLNGYFPWPCSDH